MMAKSSLVDLDANHRAHYDTIERHPVETTTWNDSPSEFPVMLAFLVVVCEVR